MVRFYFGGLIMWYFLCAFILTLGFSDAAQRNVLPSRLEGLKAQRTQAAMIGQLYDVGSMASPGNLQENGNLTEEGVIKLIEKIRASDTIPDQIKKNFSQNYTAKEIKGEGGAQTLQLFLIFKKEAGSPTKARGEPPKSPVFVLKGLKKAQEEISNIKIIRNSPLKRYIYNRGSSNQPRNIPALALDVSNFSYTDQKNKKHDIALIDCASGRDLRKFILSWTKASSGERVGTHRKKIVAEKALYRMGQNLALIHREFNQEKNTINGKEMIKVMGKTFTHGDLHPHNVFYDENQDRMIFIDNESFAISVQKPRDPSIDIMKLYGRLVASNLSSKHQYQQKGISDDEFCNFIVKPLVCGYIDGYKSQDPTRRDPQERKKVIARLNAIITGQGAFKTYVENRKTIVNPIELQKNRKVCTIPLFQKINQGTECAETAPARPKSSPTPLRK